MAVYGFARLTDDVGDEAPGDRSAQLDELEAELDAAVRGKATHPTFVPLEPLLAELDCGAQPFRDLIEANRVDQRVHAYETFEELRGYCLLSAAPVGRIVLSIFDTTSPPRTAMSDDVCVGLQVVEHLQDVGEDARRGRVYLPGVDLDAAGCDAAALTAPVASPSLRRVVEVNAARAAALLDAEGPLSRTLRLQPRLAVLGFAGGGRAALDAIRRADYDVLAVTCRPTRGGVARHVLSSLLRPERRPPR
jgi:squalene synthase HpnC